MNIDCDGNQGPSSNCNQYGDKRSRTSFKDDVEDFGISDLARLSTTTSFSIIRTSCTKMAFAPNPEDHGVRPFSIAAVVCGQTLVGLQIC